MCIRDRVPPDQVSGAFNSSACTIHAPCRKNTATAHPAPRLLLGSITVAPVWFERLVKARPLWEANRPPYAWGAQVPLSHPPDSSIRVGRVRSGCRPAGAAGGPVRVPALLPQPQGAKDLLKWRYSSRQFLRRLVSWRPDDYPLRPGWRTARGVPKLGQTRTLPPLSLIHISEPTRPY